MKKFFWSRKEGGLGIVIGGSEFIFISKPSLPNLYLVTH